MSEGIGDPPLIRDFQNDEVGKFLLNQELRDLHRIARRISFLDSDGAIGDGRKALNFDAVWVNYISNAVANTEDTVNHNLGRTPLGMWVSVPDKASVVYRGGTAWTSTQVFLKADVATVTVDILLF